jgi:glutathionylspermidine synthase
MRRISVQPRPDWPAKVEALGLTFHSQPGPYWDETVVYEFSMPEILDLERVSQELFGLCCKAVQQVVSDGLWDRFQIPRRFESLIRRSWEEDDLALYGRFDLGIDPTGAPKLYEFNADTPTSLLETAVVQWLWLQEVDPGRDQFNSIHERLVKAWKTAASDSPESFASLHFACCEGSPEELATTVYLQDTALQAGLSSRRLFVDQIGWNGSDFVDLQNRPIRQLFKLYPWEWMLREPFAEHLPITRCRFIEPPWKMILSNKEILVLLWELFPDHPNLLPASRSPGALGEDWIEKPVFGRGGAGIRALVDGTLEQTTGDAPELQSGSIFQKLALPRSFDGKHPVLGSWIIAGEAAGIGVRESDTRLVTETSRFVPHRIA